MSERIPPVSLWRLFNRMNGWISLVLFAVLIGLTLISLAELRLAKRFADEGLEATAIVQDKELRKTRDSDGNTKTTYYFILAFQTRAGSDVTTRRSVPRATYQKTEIGSSMQIWYLQSQPEKIETTQGSHEAGATTARIIGLVVGLAGLGGFWYSGRLAVAAVRARRYGAREPVTVTGLRPTKYRVNKRHHYRVTWREASGREGQSMSAKQDRFEGIREGDVIDVYQGIKRAWWVGDVGERADP